MIKEGSTYQGRRYEQKREKRMKKEVIYQEAQHT
jgi:hypothetical protein